MPACLRRPQRRIALACLSLLFACSDAREIGVPPANPKSGDPIALGRLSTSALDAVLTLDTWIGSVSGYVAMFARDGHVVHTTTVGYADIESRRPMQLETRFRIASMTKPVTAVAALILIQEERLGLDDPVASYIPAAGTLRVADRQPSAREGPIATVALERPLTVRDLLTFTAGIGNQDDPSELGRLWSARDLYAGTGSLEERVDRILTAPLYEQPGERWRYGWSADVLARVVEVVAREPFDQFLERRVLAPLGMTSTGFLAPGEERTNLATMYTREESGDLTPVDSPQIDAVGWTPGGSGLVSTAGDYMRFALMLWNGGTYAGTRILSPQSVELMTRAHVASGPLEDQDIEGEGWGLGLAVVVDSDATPLIDRDGDFWWSGYYGTSFFVSPEAGLVGVILTQSQPGPFNRMPYVLFLAPAFAFWGS